MPRARMKHVESLTELRHLSLSSFQRKLESSALKALDSSSTSFAEVTEGSVSLSLSSFQRKLESSALKALDSSSTSFAEVTEGAVCDS